MSYLQQIKRFLVEEDGPTAVEYAIMGALIGIVVIASATLIGTQANLVFSTIASHLGGVV
jgi:pilus assembly protein Flp/PilA